MNNNLNRFLEAQESHYQQALSEIISGRKKGHWMWYIFPQFTGLGHSEKSKYYSIKNLNEAKEYLNHPILGSRLREITTALLKLENTSADRIFGSPDNLKLQSCMTLFSIIEVTDDNIFKRVIEKYFDNCLDEKTFKQLEYLKGGI